MKSLISKQQKIIEKMRLAIFDTPCICASLLFILVCSAGTIYRIYCSFLHTAHRLQMVQMITHHMQ